MSLTWISVFYCLQMYKFFEDYEDKQQNKKTRTADYFKYKVVDIWIFKITYGCWEGKHCNKVRNTNVWNFIFQANILHVVDKTAHEWWKIMHTAFYEPGECLLKIFENKRHNRKQKFSTSPKPYFRGRNRHIYYMFHLKGEI